MVPFKLTAEDIHSVLLNADESKAIDDKYKQMIHERVKTEIVPKFKEIAERKDKLMDELARQAGFSQFDENDEGTGLRNYTALNKPKTQAVKQQLELFDRLYNESDMKNLIKENNSLVDAQYQIREEINQLRFREILSITNERITSRDADGNIILSPEQYLAALDACTDEKERIELKSSLTSPMDIPYKDGTKTVQVDRGLVPFLQEMIEAGYATGMSCSGLLADHPNERYLNDDELGQFVQGECICYNKQGSIAYLTFWKPEAIDIQQYGRKINTAEQIEDIRDIAEAQGWVIEDTKVFFQPSIRLMLPLTYDGCGTRKILHEASDITKEKYPGLYDDDYRTWLVRRAEVLQDVVKTHGGVIRWTDDMIKKKWNNLTQSLVLAQQLKNPRVDNETLRNMLDRFKRVKEKVAENEKKMQRVTDIVIGCKTIWGDYKVRCKIDGIQQPAENLTSQEKDIYRRALESEDSHFIESIKEKIILKHYANELAEGQDINKGLKR